MHQNSKVHIKFEKALPNPDLICCHPKEVKKVTVLIHTNTPKKCCHSILPLFFYQCIVFFLSILITKNNRYYFLTSIMQLHIFSLFFLLTNILSFTQTVRVHACVRVCKYVHTRSGECHLQRHGRKWAHVFKIPSMD